MWFGKWFNRHRDEEHDEPARFAAPQIVRSTEDDSTKTRSASPQLAKPRPAKGFDPYNSGTFQRRNAWERISRR